MKYSRFEDLPVWQSAMRMAQELYGLTRRLRLRRSLSDQLERAALSVSNNIAEGFERGTTQELLTFLYIARGSAGELRSALFLLETLPKGAQLRSEITNLRSLCESISRQLRAWADSLQNSEIKGQRYLSRRESSRAATTVKPVEEIRDASPQPYAILSQLLGKNTSGRRKPIQRQQPKR